ncbi:MAG: shikimate kinase [Segetibacter sp.]|nr:shikimate kinase [Segetibacter sp.]
MEALSNTPVKKAAVSKIPANASIAPGLKVFLIGMMGAGKSYWGERLKKKLKMQAFDLDSVIEAMEEKSVAEIFEEDGEEAFRKKEAKMLRLFGEKKQFILSCGGGTPCHNNNLEWMNKNGITIWINEPVKVLAERLKDVKATRPLICYLNNDEFVDFLSKKLEERKEFYSKATYELSGEITEEKLIKILQQHA